MSRFNFEELLLKDTIEQFNDKPKILALIKVFAKQFQDVSDFYEQLDVERELSVAIGKQLDGIGDILVLNRIEAGLLNLNTDKISVIEDDLYRRYLYYKLLKNNTNCTYKDILKGLSYFWDKPLYYTETSFLESDIYRLDEYREYFIKHNGREPVDDNEAIDYWYEHNSGYLFEPDTIIKDRGYQPATMIFDTGEMEGFVDTTPLIEAPVIRAAGVTLRIYGRTSTPIESKPLKIQSGLGFSVTSSDLPFIEREYDFSTKVKVKRVPQASVLRSGIPEASILTTSIPSL